MLESTCIISYIYSTDDSNMVEINLEKFWVFNESRTVISEYDSYIPCIGKLRFKQISCLLILLCDGVQAQRSRGMDI